MESSTNNKPSNNFGEFAQNIAPYGIVMSVFTIVYSIWFGFAWGFVGWVLFALILAYSASITFVSIKNIKHSKQFTAHASAEGQKIGKSMGILSAITYISI